MHIGRTQPACWEGQIPIAPDRPARLKVNSKHEVQPSRGRFASIFSSANKSRDGIGSWNGAINPKAEYKMYKSVPWWRTVVGHSWN